MAEWLGSMRHLEPRQIKEQQEPGQPRRRPGLVPLAALVVALSLAGGFGLTRYYTPAAADHVTQQEQQQRAQAFQRMAPLKLERIPAQRTQDAVTAMNLPAAEDQALRRDLKAAAPAATATPTPAAQPAPESLRLIELVLWDTDAPDNDSVRISSGGFTREVILAKTPTVVYMPYGGSGPVQITGVHDGGGGITLGVKGSDSSVLMPVMSVGQVIALPVRLP